MARKKRPDEWITQLNITNRLNSISETESIDLRRKIRDELHSWTYGFWLKKFKMIRKTLDSGLSHAEKCQRIRLIIDTPHDGLQNIS